MKCEFSRIFIPQAVLDEWSVGEGILLNGDVLTLAPSGWQYQVTPAVHIQKCSSGQDAHGLVGKVRREEDLRGEGAEVYQGSVVWGEDAYDGAPGFLASRILGANEPPKDAELLAKFVLEKI
jgi:hypothetical protein